MPELGPYGSVRGARDNSRPYRESPTFEPSGQLLTPEQKSLTKTVRTSDAEHQPTDSGDQKFESRRARHYIV
jgi:hypothetical protein